MQNFDSKCIKSDEKLIIWARFLENLQTFFRAFGAGQNSLEGAVAFASKS